MQAFQPSSLPPTESPQFWRKPVMEHLLQSPRVGYVMKRYPRYSETFVVNEILAQEAAGLEIEIYSLRSPLDTHFQNAISQVRAPVHYLPSASVKSTELWKDCHELGADFPGLWTALSAASFASVVDAWQALQLVKHIRDRKLTHLHAHFATAAATVAQLAAKIARISYSVTMHAKDIFHESVEHDDLNRKIADAKFVVTVSAFNWQYLTEQFGFPEKIHRVYNGLDLELFGFNPNTRNEQRIISVGRLVPKKGFCHLINACRILADRGVNFSCEIVGSGELEEELGSQIKSLALADRIRLSGPLPQNVLREKISNATVFAAPCVIGPDGNRDGLPTVITESMALGTPCVASDVTGIPEIVRNGETGLIVRQGDEVALASGLEKMLLDGEERARFSRTGRKLIENEFDIHANVAQIRELVLAGESSHIRQSSGHLVGV